MAESKLHADGDAAVADWQLLQDSHFNVGVAWTQLDLLDKHCAAYGWKWTLDAESRSDKGYVHLTREALEALDFKRVTKLSGVQRFVCETGTTDPSSSIEDLFPRRVWGGAARVLKFQNENERRPRFLIQLAWPKLTSKDLVPDPKEERKFSFVDVAMLEEARLRIVRVEQDGVFVSKHALDFILRNKLPSTLRALFDAVPSDQALAFLGAASVAVVAAYFRDDFPRDVEPTDEVCIDKFLRILSRELDGNPVVTPVICKGSLFLSATEGAGAHPNLLSKFPTAVRKSTRVYFDNVPALYRQIREREPDLVAL